MAAIDELATVIASGLRESPDVVAEKTAASWDWIYAVSLLDLAERRIFDISQDRMSSGFQPVSRKSPNSLYSLDIASFTMGAEYDQKDARGFINLIGLPIQVRASVEKAAKRKKK